MAVIYVKEQGAYVKKIGERIIVEKNKKELADIPIYSITNISIIGNVQVTTQAMQMLMQNGIDVCFFTFSGNYIGQASADNSKNIFLRFSQYECYQDLEKRLAFARIIVKNKVENQISLILHNNWKDNEYDYRDDIKQMKQHLATLPDRKTANEIMGVEGICSAIYFKSYGNMFKCKIKFEGRNRRPPKDPINVILSLAYTFLTKEVSSYLDSESFENYLGFLHGIKYGRKSLPLDIVEEFRQPVVDRLVLRLFNKQMLCEFDFEKIDDQIVLSEDGFKKFCTAYEKWMQQPISSYDKRNFRCVIREQINLLKHAIREKKEYVPYNWEVQYVSGEL